LGCRRPESAEGRARELGASRTRMSRFESRDIDPAPFRQLPGQDCRRRQEKPQAISESNRLLG
jgi:hypothetical protein